MTSLGFLIIGGMIGYIFGYTTAILMTMAKKTDEESKEEMEIDRRSEDL